MAWGDYIETKHAQQQGTQSTNSTPGDIVGAIAIVAVCVLVIVGIVLLIKKTRKRVVASNSSVEKRYKRLETFAVWRFSKVLFWVIIVAAALFLMLYQDDYGHYTLARLGVILLVLSYPLYILFRHASFYIAYGKSKHKGSADH